MPALGNVLGLGWQRKRGFRPPFHRFITSVSVLECWQTDIGLSTSGGTAVSWLGTKNGNVLSQGTGGAQPVYSAADATLNGKPSLTFDGVDDWMSCSTLNPPLVGTTPLFIWMLAKSISWTGTDSLCGAEVTNNRISIKQAGVSPNLRQQNAGGVGVNESAGGTIGSWFRVRAFFNNAVADYIKVGAAAPVTGVAAGNSASTGVAVGAAGGATFGNVAIAIYLLTAGEPNVGELTALDTEATAWGGAGVLV